MLPNNATSIYWPRYRTIVLGANAESFVKKHEKEVPRFEDRWQGVEWFLARVPDKGTPRHPKEPNKYLLEGFSSYDIIDDTRELWILYSFNEDAVYIHEARFKD